MNFTWGGKRSLNRSSVARKRHSATRLGLAVCSRAMANDPLKGMEQEGIELVQKLPHFKQLTFDETKRLFGLTQLVKKKKGEVIVEDDALGEALYIIKAGAVRVMKGDRP